MSLWFQLRTRVLKTVTAAQERRDMRSGCHAAKILPVGVRVTKNAWCLSSITPFLKLQINRAIYTRAIYTSAYIRRVLNKTRTFPINGTFRLK